MYTCTCDQILANNFDKTFTFAIIAILQLLIDTVYDSKIGSFC